MATCGTSGPAEACPTPQPGSDQEGVLQRVRQEAEFTILYPCSLPGSQHLATGAVIGEPGRQRTELVFAGPFEMTIRQSQVPPPVAPDPAGASRRVINLFPNVRATLIEINDGSGAASYHYFWERNGIHYELQAVGPPLQERSLRDVATSLQ